MNNSPKIVQPYLNLTLHEDFLAANLEGEQVSKLLEIVARQKLSVEEICERAMNGRFQIEYDYGALIIDHAGKSERWNLSLCPTSLMDTSA
jgi:hypothetical protein